MTSSLRCRQAADQLPFTLMHPSSSRDSLVDGTQMDKANFQTYVAMHTCSKIPVTAQVW
jgi:hypothetical protein